MQNTVALDLETTFDLWNKPLVLSVTDGTETEVVSIIDNKFNTSINIDNKIWIGHNIAMFDMPILQNMGYQPSGIWDTMVVEQWLSGGNIQHFPKYAELVLKYCGVTLNKELQKADWSGPLSPEQIEYCQNDVKYLLPIAKAQYAACKELGMLPHLKVFHEAARVWFLDVWKGFPLDLEKRRELQYACEVEYKNKLLQLLDYIPIKVLLKSNYTGKAVRAFEEKVKPYCATLVPLEGVKKPGEDYDWEKFREYIKVTGDFDDRIFVNPGAPAFAPKAALHFGISLESYDAKHIDSFIESNPDHPFVEFVNVLMAIRRVGKIKGTYINDNPNVYGEVDGELRVKPGFSVTATGRLTFSPYCFPVDTTELLTPSGWKSLNDINDNDIIMTATKDLHLVFDKVLNKVPLRNEIVFSKGFIEATDNHRFLRFGTGKKDILQDCLTKDLKPYHKIPVAGIILGGDLLDNSVLFWAGLMLADGWYNSEVKQWDTQFKHPRKKAWLQQQQQKDIQYLVTKKLNCIRFKLSKELSSVILKIVNPDKTINLQYLLQLGYDNLKAFLDGFLLGDGSVSGSGFRFTNTVAKTTFDLITICHLLGFRCSYYLEKYDNKPDTRNQAYHVNAIPKLFKTLGVKDKANNEYHDAFEEKTRLTAVSCVSVRTGYILVKQGSNIFIAGNCQIPRPDEDDEVGDSFRNKLQALYIPPKGYTILACDYCLHPKTEYLTQRGWLKVLDLTEDDLVWQVNKETLAGSFVKPIRIIKKEYTGDMITFGGLRGSLSVTDNHTMLFVGQQTQKYRPNSANIRYVAKSQEVIPSRTRHLKLASTTENKKVSYYSKQDLDLACLLAADSYYDTSRKTPYYQISLSKSRKRNRCNMLLGSGRIDNLREYHTMQTENWYIPMSEVNSDLLVGKKLQIQNIGDNQIEEFLESLSAWDGSLIKQGFRWGSTDESQVDLIQAICVRNGYEARKIVRTYINPKHNTYYELRITKDHGIRISEENRKVEKYSGLVGCVTVPEGFILVRSEGQTFITGNCSMESVAAGIYYRDSFKLKSVTEGFDPYLLLASKVFGFDYSDISQTKELKKDKKVLRQAMKAVELARNFGAGVWKIDDMMKTICAKQKLQTISGQKVIDAWNSLYPNLAGAFDGMKSDIIEGLKHFSWYDEDRRGNQDRSVVSALKSEEVLISVSNTFGLQRIDPAYKMCDWVRTPQYINFPIQSSCSVVTLLAVILVKKHFPSIIIPTTIHDSLIMFVPAAGINDIDLDEVKENVVKLMQYAFWLVFNSTIRVDAGYTKNGLKGD